MSPSLQAGGPTAELSAFVAGLPFDKLPAAVVACATDVILDALGCAIGAWRDDPEKADVMAKAVSTFRAAPVASSSSLRRTCQAELCADHHDFAAALHLTDRPVERLMRKAEFASPVLPGLAQGD